MFDMDRHQERSSLINYAHLVFFLFHQEPLSFTLCNLANVFSSTSPKGFVALVSLIESVRCIG